jgi:O-antigen/teichoic acid export membrane protein
MKLLRSFIDGSYIKILTNAASIVITMLVTSGIGFVYWWVAAHQFPPEAVGFASAAVSAMMLLSTVGVLGFGTFLIGELPRQPNKRGTLIFTALLVSGIVSAALGLLFALVSRWISSEFLALSSNIGGIALFILGVSLSTVGYVSDQASIGLLRGDVQFWRNTTQSVVKIALLLTFSLWLGSSSGIAIFATWVLGGFASLLGLGILVVLKFGSNMNIKPNLSLLPSLRRNTLEHHALNLALQAPGLALPVIVTALLSARTNAYFYASWMVATIASVGPAALTTILYAVGAADPSALGGKMRMTLKLSYGIALFAGVGLLFCSDLILRLFNASYAEQASWCLRYLGLGVFPLVIKYHYVAICRIYKRIPQAAKWMVIAGVVE